ncbi:hypothetical protein GBA52_008419 [Prunus armeniaca]|nr:hypothetical protein GBA52_008419 [Prunus armeniaca]
MASSSTLDLPSISHVISVRLESDNYPTWLAQIVPVLRSRCLLSYIDGSCPSPSPTISDPKAKESESSPPSLISNPDYEDWVQKDQLVLSLSSMVLFIIKFLLRLLPKPPHVTLDNLALAGAPVHESDLLAVVMNNVGPLYENTVAAAQAREKPIGMPDLEALLLSAERCLQASSSPAISSGATAMPRRHHNSGKGVLGPPPSSFGSNSSSRGPLQCYNCHGFGHVAAVCPSKSTSVPTPPTRLQGMTAHHLSHGGAQQWVADTGANTHITNDLSHLSLAREYHGSDNVGGVLGGTGFGDGEDSFPGQE